MLPERQHYPNLASRVMGLVLRRLSADWQERWGHPVLVVESLVDESRYRGTGYRACGFEAAGLTAGFGRSSRDFYEAHGQPKQLYLRELRPRARRQLRQARWPAELAAGETDSAGPCPFRAPGLGQSHRPVAGRAGTRGFGPTGRCWQVIAVELASFRNLAIGLYELQKERQRTQADSLRAGCQQQTFTSVWPLLNA